MASSTRQTPGSSNTSGGVLLSIAQAHDILFKTRHWQVGVHEEHARNAQLKFDQDLYSKLCPQNSLLLCQHASVNGSLVHWIFMKNTFLWWLICGRLRSASSQQCVDLKVSHGGLCLQVAMSLACGSMAGMFSSSFIVSLRFSPGFAGWQMKSVSSSGLHHARTSPSILKVTGAFRWQ